MARAKKAPAARRFSEEDEDAPSLALFETKEAAMRFLDRHFTLVTRGRAKGMYKQPVGIHVNFYVPVVRHTSRGFIVTTSHGHCLAVDGKFISGDPSCPRDQ